jgi:MFS family permease
MPQRASLVTPVLVAGCAVIVVSFGIRGSFGVFQIPIGREFGWPRADYSLAIAIQNLAWGIAQPLFGALAEKIGDRRSVVLGAVLYAIGLVLSAVATTPAAHQLLGIVIGFGIAGTGFGVILAVVARSASESNRSMSLAIVTAAGSAGQVVGAPVAQWLLSIAPWQTVFVVFAAAILATLAVVPMMRSPKVTGRAELEETLGGILAKAARDPSFALIAIGFFSCGYQLGFLTAHFPALVTEMCGPIDPGGTLARLGIGSQAALGAVALSVIGLANIVGTLTAGWLGQRYKRKYLLSGLYLGRTILSAAFIALPVTPASVLVFSVGMGAMWLATVPLTSGLVAYIYGLRYLGTLYGIVFLSHQVGGFLGVWLGGQLYDLYGDYRLVWWIGVGVGLVSVIVHLPVKERPLSERSPAGLAA